MGGWVKKKMPEQRERTGSTQQDEETWPWALQSPLQGQYAGPRHHEKVCAPLSQLVRREHEISLKLFNFIHPPCSLHILHLKLQLWLENNQHRVQEGIVNDGRLICHQAPQSHPISLLNLPLPASSPKTFQ